MNRDSHTNIETMRSCGVPDRPLTPAPDLIGGGAQREIKKSAE
jgi:hypothetical protein